MFYNPYGAGNLLTRGIKINWSNLLEGTQKTLGVINQAIPIFYQMKPIFNSAKTMIRIADGLKDTPTSTNDIDVPSSNNRPIFYI